MYNMAGFSYLDVETDEFPIELLDNRYKMSLIASSSIMSGSLRVRNLRLMSGEERLQSLYQIKIEYNKGIFIDGKYGKQTSETFYCWLDIPTVFESSEILE